MPNYHPAFREGEYVQIVGIERLHELQAEWGDYYHRPADEQLQYGDTRCRVVQALFEHGGDALYELEAPSNVHGGARNTVRRLPGVWHEDCLRDFIDSDDPTTVTLAGKEYAVAAVIRNGQPVVIVTTVYGIECLVKRCHEGQQTAIDMNAVAMVRSVAGFESRYAFDGLAADYRRGSAKAT